MEGRKGGKRLRHAGKHKSKVLNVGDGHVAENCASHCFQDINHKVQTTLHYHNIRSESSRAISVKIGSVKLNPWINNLKPCGDATCVVTDLQCGDHASM